MLELLDPDDPAYFPPSERALDDPNGLLAVGGDLSPTRLINAYKRGIFPWYCDGQPILWWSPDPRCVVIPQDFRIRRSLRKVLRKGLFTVTFDRAFDAVMAACQEPRSYESETWITSDMRTAYNRLHEMGVAHSVECWHQGELVGGIYGLAIGRVFFGESMFHRMTDASKVAFVHLVEQLKLWECHLIDCQVTNDHLLSLGACEIHRSEFEALLREHLPEPSFPQPWQLEWHYE